MTDNEDHFDEFQDHTLLKHAIVSAYLQQWCIKLLSPGSLSSAVHFIDAFAGAGSDDKGAPGSPQIAMKIAANVREMSKTGKFVRVGGRVFVSAIEKRPKYFNRLEEVTRSLVDSSDGDSAVYKGELVDVFDQLSTNTQGAPLLSFLDPFGISGLNASLYPTLLAGPKDEIFALFAHLGAARMHAVITKDTADYYSDYWRDFEKPELFEEVQEKRLQEKLVTAQRRHAHLDITAESCRRHLQAALGGDDWMHAMEAIPDDRLAHKFVELFADRMIAASAMHILIIPMSDSTGHQKYTLVHASKSVHGFVAMKKSVSESLSARTELSELMRERIRADLTLDSDSLVTSVQREFAGQTPWWSDMYKKQPLLNSVRRFLLERTPMFPFQAEAVKEILSERGWIEKRENRREVVVVPAATPQ